MQKVRRFAVFIVFCLSLFVLSGCSLLFQSQADQSRNGEKKSEQAEKKLTSEEVLKQTLENLQKAPGLHYTIDSDKLNIDEQLINQNRFCFKMEFKMEDKAFQYCYDDPLFSVKPDNEPMVTIDMSNPGQSEFIFKDETVIYFFILAEIGNPKTILKLGLEEGNLTMEEQNDAYVLKGAIPADRYVDALIKSYQDHKLLNRFEKLQEASKNVEEEMKSKGAYKEFQLEIKADRQKLQLKEIKMVNPKGEEIKIEIKGEISDLNMNSV